MKFTTEITKKVPREYAKRTKSDKGRNNHTDLLKLAKMQKSVSYLYSYEMQHSNLQLK